MAMSKKYIVSLDQGTTSSRTIIYDDNFEVVATEQKEIEQLFPNEGWVEHDPNEIWNSQFETLKKVCDLTNISSSQIQGIGITNQRETTIVWNKKTGKPIYNAIVWQDRRTADFCNELTANGQDKLVRSKTGLIIDSYFSATKIHWILNHVTGAKELAEQGDLLFGTVDTWLVWKLTGGNAHITDVSNASRTMLFNIHTLAWDEDLLELFKIPKTMLPEVVESSGKLARTDLSVLDAEITISGIAGDQQSALFGQLCTESGMAKSTYGTGCFLMLNTGSQVIDSSHKMLSTVAWKINGEVSYALEGSVFIGGAVIQWLRDKLEFFVEASDCEKLAESAPDNGGVYFVPALTGLGAPHWDPTARGTIFGISRGTTKSHLTRAALESICFQVNDVLKSMSQDLDENISQLRVDGGAAANDLLLQFQSDISGVRVLKPTHLETTALGVAFLASIGLGIHSVQSLKNKWVLEQEFYPEMDEKRVKLLNHRWNEAISRSKGWNA